MQQNKFYPVFNNVVNYVTILPYLYRYEDQEWIDKFFETGELLISSFHEYSKYNDNQLGDTSEGQTINFGTSSNEVTMATVSGVGSNAYTFCTSTFLDENLFNTFNRNSVFRIKDPLNFILQVQKSLTRVNEVLHGNCIYLKEKTIKKEISNFDIEDLREDDGSGYISMQKLFAKSSEIGGPEQFFIKKMVHQHQAEYRIIWNTDRKVENSIVIDCPEAREYCEKVDL